MNRLFSFRLSAPPHGGQHGLPARSRQAITALVSLLLVAGCGLRGEPPAPEPPVPATSDRPSAQTTAPPAVDVDSLANALVERAERLPPDSLPGLEDAARDWLARLQYEDPALLPQGADPDSFYRRSRGRLLDAVGWAAYRRGDLRQAEAALVSAEAEINSRGTTEGYARHFLHLGRIHQARGRADAAIGAFMDAEVRGMGALATPELEAAYRRRHGSLAGLDDLRSRERARVEDERRQFVVARTVSWPLPAFRWSRRTGPPLATSELTGRPAVIAFWNDACGGCSGYAGALSPMVAALRGRDARLVGVWLGDDPGDAGPPQTYSIVTPDDPEAARRAFGVGALPALFVVDAGGRIRYRHGGAEATPPPIDDIILQLDHLERRRGRAAAGQDPDREGA